MLFGALFSSYVLLRIGSPDWPEGSSILNIPIGTFNTLVLITSSITMVMAWASCMLKNLNKFRLYMGLTVFLGFVFLGVKSFEYSEKFHHHLYPEESTYLAIYFTMTALHAIHVICGMIVNSYFLTVGSKMWKTDHTRFANRVEISGLFWHFVDLVWIFLFPVLYLL